MKGETFEWGNTYTSDGTAFDEALLHMIRRYEVLRKNAADSMRSVSSQLRDGAVEVMQDAMRQVPSEHQILTPLLTEARREELSTVINIMVSIRSQVKREGVGY